MDSILTPFIHSDTFGYQPSISDNQPGAYRLNLSPSSLKRLRRRQSSKTGCRKGRMGAVNQYLHIYLLSSFVYAGRVYVVAPGYPYFPLRSKAPTINIFAIRLPFLMVYTIRPDWPKFGEIFFHILYNVELVNGEEEGLGI